MSIKILVVFLAAIAGAVGVTLYVVKPQNLVHMPPVACTTEAKICPDGSAVGRTGPDCMFADCPLAPVSQVLPKSTDTSITPKPAVLNTPQTTPPPSSMSVAKTTHAINQAVMIKGYSRDELLAMAGNIYASGNVPLGDDKYVTSSPKKGYVYLCNVHKDNPGSMVNGPWMHGTTWNFLEKISIAGSVHWGSATFLNTISGVSRILSGNGLPIDHNTGTFPVASSDPAATYDKNPNTISAQSLKQTLPKDPIYSDTPYCMGGEVGMMLSGVALFNAFDAGLRDAGAHELQDSCDGHPQGSGEYHYHGLSSCFKDTDVSTILGYAYDGFPITGATVATNKYLTTDDLDECHGITSEVAIDGKSVMTYHYVMTVDFPYSASCFRGKPITTGPSADIQKQSQSGSSQAGTTGSQQGGGGAPPNGGPPAEATAACRGMSDGASCSFTTPMGEMSGVCHTPPNSSLACVPPHQ